jgi:hypothetical protein
VKTSSDLFDLIKSLTGHEKRYFILFCSFQAGSKKYLKLYYLIEKQKTYNEEKLISSLKGDPMCNQLAVSKNYLYTMILKALNSYNANFKTSFASSIDTIEILYYKGLFKQCFKIITKLKKQIYKLEKFHLLFEVLIWERALLTQMEDFKNYFDLRNNIKKEEDELLQKISSINTYSYASFYSYYSYIKDDLAFKHIREDDFKKNAAFLIAPVDESRLCFQEKVHRLSGQSYYYHFVKDFDKASASSKKLLQLMHDNPLQIELMPFGYLAACMTYMLMLLQLGHYDEILSHCKKVRALETNLKQTKSSRLLQAAIFNTAPSYELAVYVTIADVKKARLLLPEIEAGIEDFKDLMNEQLFSVWCFNVALTYFLDNEYKLALKWLNHIINETFDRIRTDFILSVTIFRLILHYELQNESFYPYLLRSSYRTISKLHFNPRILATLLSGLKILFNATDKKKIEQSLKQIRRDLTPLLSYSDFRGWLNYFDITQWLDSKIHNTSFAEIAQKEALKRRVKAK